MQSPVAYTPSMLKAWMLYTLDNLQGHYPMVAGIPIGKLIDNDFQAIDLTDPQVQRLGQAVGHEPLPAEMTLGQLKEAFLVSVPNDARLGKSQELALQRMIDDYLENPDSWSQIRSFWRFISQDELVPDDLEDPKVLFDLDLPDWAKPQYKVTTVMLEDCGDYDDETDEILYHHTTLPHTFYSNSLDRAIAGIRDVGEKSLKFMAKNDYLVNCHLRYAEVIENGEVILKAIYERKVSTETMAIDVFPDNLEDARMKENDAAMVSALTKAYGKGFVDRVVDRTFGRDLGL